MVVRELITVLGFKTDNASIQKAESGMNKLMGTAKTLARTFAAVFVAAKVREFFGNVVDYASSANETLNVLDASFKEHQQGVKDWADTFASAAGRSRYELREMAGTLGAVLNPMMDQNKEAVAGMSTELAELAVDLGSFYNAAEPDVLIALRSAVTGEAEPMKRFGVVMNVAALEAFALEKGVTKSFKSMSIAEKTQLRYNFLMEKTSDAQGDAIKTSDGWANATKRVQGRLRDMATDIGRELMPGLERTLDGIGNIIDTLEPWGKALGRVGKSVIDFSGWLFRLIGNMSTTSKIILGSIAVLYKWRTAIKILTSPFTKWLAIISAAMLIIEDFTVWLDGGNSALGKLLQKLKEWTGIDFDSGLRSFIDALNILSADPEPFDWGMYWEEVTKVLKDYWGLVADWYREWWNDITSWAGEKIDTIKGFFSDIAGLNFVSLFSAIWQGFKTPFVIMYDIAKAFIDFFINVFTMDIGDAFTTLLVDLGQSIIDFGEGAKGVLSGLWGFIKGLLPSIYDSVVNALVSFGEAIKSITWEGVKNVLSSIGDYILQWVKEKYEAIVGPLKSIGRWLISGDSEKEVKFKGAKIDYEAMGMTPEMVNGMQKISSSIGMTPETAMGPQSLAGGSVIPFAPMSIPGGTTNNRTVQVTNAPQITVQVDNMGQPLDKVDLTQQVSKEVAAAMDRQTRTSAMAFANKKAG